MITAAQAAANAANAQLSTGPRTPEGKERSSQNARRHCLTCRQIVVREDERESFDELRESLLAELGPEGALETLTFNQLLHAAWNLRRFQGLEADLAANGRDPLLDDSAAQTLDRLGRYAARAERTYYRALRELRILQTNRVLRLLKLEPDVAALAPAIVSVNDLTKRTHAEVRDQALKMAVDMATQALDLRAASLISHHEAPRS